jgi:hypothetical protein
VNNNELVLYKGPFFSLISKVDLDIDIDLYTDCLYNSTSKDKEPAAIDIDNS